jgi:hypothetical protein
MAEDLGKALVSVDVNPLVSRAGTGGPMALDAVVALSGKGDR